MNWFQENKFLSGFLAAVVIAVGVLAYLAFSASGSFDTAKQDYTQKTTELQRLHGLSPYPEESNAAKLRDQAKELDQRISNLQSQLASMQLAVEPMTPERFQDVLKEAVRSAVQKAADAKIELPAKFYLGFDPYETAPPRPEAAPLLGQQLKAVAYVVDELIKARVSKLNNISRLPLPEESAAKPAASPTPAGARGPAAAAAKAQGPDAISAVPFDVSFVAEQDKFRQVLNTLAASKNPLLVVRALQVENDNPKGPSRTTPAQAGAQPGAEAGAALPAVDGTQQPSGPAFSIVLGAEKTIVNMRIDMLKFAEPASKSKAK